VTTLCLPEHVGFSLLEMVWAILTTRGMISALGLQFC
jgi:hypothetical protein